MRKANLFLGLALIAQPLLASPRCDPARLPGSDIQAVRKAIGASLAGRQALAVFFSQNPVVVRRVALRDNGKTVFARFGEGDYCGSGGCSALILHETAAGYEVVRRLSLVQPPVYVLRRSHNGWHDLAVGVRGGGAAPRTVVLTAGNGLYASNPTTLKAARIPAASISDEVITRDGRFTEGCRIEG